ncbi:unnamed protein product [Clonostachys chloroleuca]|uniref:LPXTG-domain-containing protein n=1 Tax=Clonostachys chloroleuca TaxID=1926264 RepID=A0AA35QE03_9HYPO|nr:unnamed protein product [Clonostachys chloroleuca]
MARLSSALFLVLSTLSVLSLALEFTPGSSCASLCLDNGETDAFDAAASSTNSSDITCLDTSFGSDVKGKKYKSCLECLAKSEKVEGSESDIHWYLYNVRYATSTCLFGLPSPASTQMNSPCILDNACKNLKGPLTEDNLNASRTDTYGYCDAASGAFKEKAVWPCVKCLQATSDQKYLSNFMIALLAGCQQKTEPGKTLSLSGTIFQSTRINITEPTENILDRPEGAGSNSLTTGAIVGIAIGAALFVLGGIALFFMHRRRKRQIEKNEKADYHASQANSPDPILPPNGGFMSSSIRSHSQQSHRGLDYLEKLDEERRTGRPSVHSTRPSQSSLPRYVPQAAAAQPSRSLEFGRSSVNYAPSAPAPAARRNHSSTTPESFALKTYSTHARALSEAGSSVPPPPPNPPPQERPAMPSLVTPANLSKLRGPKTYTPPTITVTSDDNQR